jgi:3-oxoadipate enol-lactonase
MVKRTYIQSGDLQLAAEVHGEGKPVIWAHGLMETKELTMQLLDGLAGYSILVYDQRGHGASTPIRDQSVFTVSAMAGDLRAVLDQVGWASAIVAGTSIGASIATEFAMLYPERVEALLLDIPAIGSETNAALEADTNAKLLRDGGASAWIAHRLRKVPVNLQKSFETRLESLFRHDGESLALAYEAVATWRCDISALGAIIVPTAVRAWPGDPIHPLALAREIAAAIPNAVLFEVALDLISDVSANQASIAEILGGLERRTVAPVAENDS